MNNKLEDIELRNELRVNGELKSFEEIKQGDIIEFKNFRDKVIFNNDRFIRAIGEYNSKINSKYVEQVSYSSNGSIKRIHLSYHPLESIEGKDFKKIIEAKK